MYTHNSCPIQLLSCLNMFYFIHHWNKPQNGQYHIHHLPQHNYTDYSTISKLQLHTQFVLIQFYHSYILFILYYLKPATYNQYTRGPIILHSNIPIVHATKIWLYYTYSWITTTTTTTNIYRKYPIHPSHTFFSHNSY